MSTQLVKAVLKWWEEHQYDTVASDEDEYNVYDEPPEFVRLALASQPAEQPRGEYPECSGDPSSCPENEGYGCCGAQPKPEQAVGDGVDEVAKKAMALDFLMAAGHVPEDLAAKAFELAAHHSSLPAVATAGDGVPARFTAIGHAASDEIHRAANLLEKLPARHANEAATIQTAVAYLREYGNETASPSAPRVVVPDGWKLVPTDATDGICEAIDRGRTWIRSSRKIWADALAAVPEVPK